MKLHSLFFILMLSLFSCSTEGDVDTTEQEGTDTVIVDAPTGGVVIEPEITTPVKKNVPVVVEKDVITSPDGSVVELSEEEPEEVVSPIFFDCEHKRREKAWMRCSEKALQDYVTSTVDFQGLEGEEHYASVKFVIRKNGSVGLVQILGSSTPEFGLAVQKAIKKLNADGLIWTPALQGDTPIDFDYFTEVEITY